jgi:hypothetical protein
VVGEVAQCDFWFPPSTLPEDVPSFVELRWRPKDHQATFRV